MARAPVRTGPRVGERLAADIAALGAASVRATQRRTTSSNVYEDGGGWLFEGRTCARCGELYTEIESVGKRACWAHRREVDLVQILTPGREPAGVPKACCGEVDRRDASPVQVLAHYEESWGRAAVLQVQDQWGSGWRELDPTVVRVAAPLARPAATPMRSGCKKVDHATLAELRQCAARNIPDYHLYVPTSMVVDHLPRTGALPYLSSDKGAKLHPEPKTPDEVAAVWAQINQQFEDALGGARGGGRSRAVPYDIVVRKVVLGDF